MSPFRMIRPETVPDVLAAEAGAGAQVRPVYADEAAERTRADYGRTSRWVLGLLGTVGATITVVVLTGATSIVWSGVDPLADLAFGFFVVLIAAVFGVPSIWLLFALHRSGRRLARAAAYWAALPYRQGRRAPTPGDWFAVRFVGFSSDLFARLITSSLAALVVVFTASNAIRAVVIASPAPETLMWAAFTVLFAAVCAGQFGGVQRIQNGMLARDPA